MNNKNINNLQIYLESKNLSKQSWAIYSSRDYNVKKVVWDQFIRAIDSIWANIAEWYGRFHYLDSAKFYYNARWSLLEAKYWLDLLVDRRLISKETYDEFKNQAEVLLKKLNAFIKIVKSQINK